ncbi:MAG: hypothetical protein ABSG17_16340 [Spirochaetia bacterium]|jgi:hypothetical protein
MAKRSALPIVLALGSALGLSAATIGDTQAPAELKTERDVQNLCETALSYVVSGDLEQCIAVLRPYATSISREDVDSLENQLKGQATTIKNSYGDPIGYVLISMENLKDTILKGVYVVKYERHLIRWSFIFYKPYSSWILDYFNYDDAIEALFGPKVAAPVR